MSKSAEFYFVRHGQTDYNVSPTKVDHTDVSLNAVGWSQAHALEPLIRTLPIRSVCHSPLKRVLETKDVIASQHSAMHHVIEELTECSGQIWDDMTSGINGEHVSCFIQRAVKGINRALEKPGPILIVAHGGIHWAFCSAMKIPNHTWLIGNCELVHFSHHEGQWKARPLLHNHTTQG